MQETQEATFEVAATLAGMLPLMAPFTAALQFRLDRMETAASTGYLNAMAAATYLVHKGVPFRKAHEKIGNAVRYALDKGCELNELTLDELKQFGDEFSVDFHDAITLRATVDCHDVIGGTATVQVAASLALAREKVAALTPQQEQVHV
jgi:argininosuccinate lyase